MGNQTFCVQLHMISSENAFEDEARLSVWSIRSICSATLHCRSVNVIDCAGVLERQAKHKQNVEK